MNIVRPAASAKIAAILVALLANSVVSAAPETEPNDTFGDRTIFTPGVTSVEGALDLSLELSDADKMFPSALVSGATNTHVVTGEAPGAPFFGAVDNTQHGVDTLLGTFDEFGSLIDDNDDGSPFGNGLGSALNGTVNADGSIRFEVTGFGDNAFDGSHDQAGNYDLFVFYDTFYVGDVDFLSFTGLTPGETVRAKITDANFDPMLAVFSNLGVFENLDDDSAGELLPQLVITVPDDGVINLAVTGFGDFDVFGEHTQAGDYELVVEPVPLPGALALFAPALAGLAFRRRRSLH